MRLIGEVERGKEHVAADKLLSIPDVLNMTMTGHVEGKRPWRNVPFGLSA
jgi:hypothetical protein